LVDEAGSERWSVNVDIDDEEHTFVRAKVVAWPY